MMNTGPVPGRIAEATGTIVALPLARTATTTARIMANFGGGRKGSVESSSGAATSGGASDRAASCAGCQSRGPGGAAEGEAWGVMANRAQAECRTPRGSGQLRTAAALGRQVAASRKVDRPAEPIANRGN